MRFNLNYPACLKILRMAAVSVAVSLALNGCRHAADARNPASVVTLHVADWGGASSDPAMNRFEADVRAEWTRTHPRIRIAQEHIPGSDEYVSKMLTAFVAGTEPDVMVAGRVLRRRLH